MHTERKTAECQNTFSGFHRNFLPQIQRKNRAS